MPTPFRERVRALLAWVAKPEGSPIDMWRRRILAAVLVGLMVLGSVAYAIGAGLAWVQGERVVVLVDTVVYALVLAVTLGRRVPYALRAATVVVVPGMLGTFFLFGFGFETSGFAWLLSCPVLASLLLGLRYGTWAVIATAVVMVVLGALIPSNVMSWTAAMPNALIMWWVSSSSVLVIAALLALSVGYLFDGLGAEAMARRAAEVEADRRQRLAALGTLSSGIAHDFNNLLQPIISDVEHAQRLLADGEDAQPVLHDILRTTDRARLLVRRILTFARPTAGTREVVNLGKLVGESQRLLLALLSTHIVLDITIEAPVYVDAEPSELQQVLLNLVNNAAQAMPAGGTVRIEVGVLQQHEILAGTILEGVPSVASLAVVDTGVGMNRETRARLFEPFYSTKSPQQGSGLGLATVHATVTALGGLVRVDSTLGHGTCMQVLLPASDAPNRPSLASSSGALDTPGTPPDPKRPAAHDLAHHTMRRVVVIDDEPAVLAGTARLLERMGYAVQRFGDPRVALAELAGDAPVPDIVLTDLAMPGLSGWEVAEALHARHPHVAVVVMTGHIASPEDEAALRPGVHAVITKPFTGSELQTTLRALV